MCSNWSSENSNFTTNLRSSAYTLDELAPNVCKWAKWIDCFSASDSQQPFFGDKTRKLANQENHRRLKAFIFYLHRSVWFHLSCLCHSRFWLSAHTASPETNHGARSWNPGLPSSARACSSRNTSGQEAQTLSQMRYSQERVPLCDDGETCKGRRYWHEDNLRDFGLSWFSLKEGPLTCPLSPGHPDAIVAEIISYCCFTALLLDNPESMQQVEAHEETNYYLLWSS